MNVVMRLVDYTTSTIDLHVCAHDGFLSQYLEIVTPLGTQEIELASTLTPEKLRWLADQVESIIEESHDR